MKKNSILLFLISAAFIALFPAEVKFAVISDLHAYDTLLGTAGKAFDDYLDSDRKLLKESSAMLDKVISLIEASNCEFIIVPGDLTKDGEAVGHAIVTAKLESLKNSGKMVFVTCGNHDIDNPDAKSFSGENSSDVESIKKEDFESIYSDFGFGDALSRDSLSLSYVASPKEGVFLIALDGCKYEKNRKEGWPLTSGRLKKETLKWLEAELSKIDSLGGFPIVFMHHGVVEHFKGQKKGYGEYVLDNNDELKKILSRHKVNLVFTGHFHANDIAHEKFKGTDIFDIETGSLVTHPCPYRFVEVNDSMVRIETNTINELEGINDFDSYKKSYIERGIKNIAEKKIKEFGVNEGDTKKLADKVAYSFLSHYQGDEVYPEGFLDMNGFSFKAKLVAFFQRDLFRGLLFDDTPDNDVIINLKTGKMSLMIKE